MRRLKTAEMKFMRHTARCSLLDHRRNEVILGEYKADIAGKKLAQYKEKCLNHISKMEDIWYLK
jgi:hypothetical protein